MTERQKTIYQILLGNHKEIMVNLAERLGIQRVKEEKSKEHEVENELDAILFEIMRQQEEILELLQKPQVRISHSDIERMKIENRIINDPELKLKLKRKK